MTFTFITKGTWSSGSSITTGTIDTTDYDFLKITVYVQGSASGMKSALRFNGDTGSNSNYTFAITNDGSSGGGYNDNTADNFQLTPAGAEGGGTGNRQAMFSTIDMQNIDGYEKLIFSKSVTNDTTGASVIHMITSDGKWKTTSGKVTSIEVMNFGSSGNFTSDDYITVWGSKGDTVSDEKTTLADATVTTSPTPTPTSSGGTVSLTSGGSNVMATTALGFTASNTWVLRFSTVFTDYDANSYWNACLSSSDGNTATAQNYLGCLFRKDGSQNFGVHDVSNGSAPNSVNSSPQQAFTNDSSSTYYWEIIRQGATSCKVNFYGTDSTYGTVTSSSEDTSVANATGLNRIKFMSDASTNNTGSITIGNVKFYNGITAVTSTTTSLAPPVNTRYEEVDTRKIYRKVTPTVNTYTFNGTSGWDFRSGTSGTITGGNVVCTGMGSGLATANNNVHDLQDELGSGNNASATAWVLRGKYKNSTTSNYVFFGLTSVDQTNPPNNSPQDYIGWSSYKSSSSDNGLDIRDNGSPDPSGKGNASVNNTNWYWIEIVRDSSSATLKLYTEANEFTGTPAFTDTESIPSGVENLRYIKFGATHNGGGSAYLTDVKFYNGATSVDTDEWKERGSA